MVDEADATGEVDEVVEVAVVVGGVDHVAGEDEVKVAVSTESIYCSGQRRKYFTISIVKASPRPSPKGEGVMAGSSADAG